MKWYLDFEFSLFIFYHLDPPQWSLERGVARKMITVDSNVYLLFSIKKQIYVVIPGKLCFHFRIPGNGANLLSLQESFPDCNGNDLGNLNV